MGCSLPDSGRPAAALNALLLTWAVAGGHEPDAVDFNRDIRPILAENCFYCHGQDAAKREADLRLDAWPWTWRDWVVAAVNADMPFDRFTIEQLAGDLLPDATVEQKIASGFNRNHLLNGEGGAIAEEQRFDTLFDRVDTTSTTWLGLTMACAQCHDHTYDPLTRSDYYRLLDAFNRLPEKGVPTRFSARVRVAPPILELPTADNTRRCCSSRRASGPRPSGARPRTCRPSW